MICEELNSTHSFSSSNSIEENNSHHLEASQDLTFIKLIGSAKFLVYLTQSQSTQEYFAMKLFPLHNGKVLPFYYNEIRFAHLCHPNVISIVHYDERKEESGDGQSMSYSRILMEYAPYGDFVDLMMTHKIKFDNKLLRTYFHQLIEGLEYLHSNGVAHMDIKPENLLLGHYFQLKIADFDLSYMKGDSKIKARGTTTYRAPEMICNTCKDPYAADIFSAGLTLFMLKSGGIVPQMEEKSYKGYNLYNLLQHNNEEFWRVHNEIKGEANFYEADFKNLFNSMTRENVSERATIRQIKSSKWYNGEIYTNEELQLVMRKNFGI
jgi:serine/threonine protein kinase